VLSLEQGTSLGDVKAHLGEPLSEVSVGNESTLSYRSWLIRFQEGELRQRIREVRSGKTSQSGPVLDSKILTGLTPGMPVRTVEKLLGPSEVSETIYEAARVPAFVLRYAYWELYFRKGRLVRRTRN
jgi:hypothetical protein